MRRIILFLLCVLACRQVAGCAPATPQPGNQAFLAMPTSSPTFEDQPGKAGLQDPANAELQTKLKLLEMEKADLLKREENLSAELRRVNFINQQQVKQLHDLADAPKDRDAYKASAEQLQAQNDQLTKQVQQLKQMLADASPMQPAKPAGSKPATTMPTTKPTSSPSQK
jgi:hypothetical protein